MSHVRRARAGRVALRAFGGLVALWLVAPILVVVPLSLTGAASFKFPPSSWSTRWYSNLFTDPTWLSALGNSLLISAIVVVVATILGTACAVGLEHGRLPGRSVVRALVLAPMIIPIVIVAVGVYAVFLPWHLVGTRLGFVLAHTALATPFVVISVSTSLAGFDRRLESAAASLGASPWVTFMKVTLPAIAPGMLGGAILAFITSFDEVVVGLFLSTPGLRTVPVQMFLNVQQIDPTIAAASTLVLAATTTAIVLTVVFNKSFRDQVAR